MRKTPPTNTLTKLTVTEVKATEVSITPKWARIAFAAAIAIGFGLYPPTTPHRAQRAKESAVNVTSVSSRSMGGNSVVTFSADAPLTRAQTWQDSEGFHVVVYKGQGSVANSARGVKVRRVGESLEFVVPVKPGSNVTVQPRFNHLDLLVNGGLNDEATNTASGATRAAQRRERQQTAPERAVRSTVKPREVNPVAAKATVLKQAPVKFDAPPPSASPVPPADVVTAQAMPPAANAPAVQGGSGTTASSVTSNTVPTTNSQPASTPPAAPHREANSDESSMSILPIVTAFVAVLGGLVALVVWRRRGQGAEQDMEEDFEAEDAEATLATTALSSKTDKTKTVEERTDKNGERRRAERRKQGERRSGLGRRTEDNFTGKSTGTSPMLTAAQQSVEGRDHKPVRHKDANYAQPAAVFSAYRVDQEVNKVVQGQAHNIEVLASRAPDDRRALEASLMKALLAPESDEQERRRARTALEEYGFVARQSATLLLGSEAYERLSAARSLGQIKSPSTLPFLLEALYDQEAAVRTEAVASLGALKLPAAIGALLDMARRHPEMPASLISRALNSCSVESFDASITGTANGALLEAGDPFTGEITRLEPAQEIEQLPQWLEDAAMIHALNELSNPDPEARAVGAQQLAQFQVQGVVDALTQTASADMESMVRATAISSLGIIGHETVFPAVLVALSDDAREVRAAAARALSRLSFDRADAYVRVIETADEETIERVASACVKAGLAMQALDRLASEDRRLAYEAFSLLALVARGGEIDLLLEAVKHHRETAVRLAAVRLLGMSGQLLTRELRPLAASGEVPEKVRAAILELVYKMDQAAVSGERTGDNSHYSVA